MKFFLLSYNLKTCVPRWVGLVVSVSTSHAVGRGFALRPGHTKDHYKNATNCFPAWHADVRVGVCQCSTDCLNGWIVCGSVYGDKHYKDLLGSIARVGYCIPVPDFYLVVSATWPLMPKKHAN